MFKHLASLTWTFPADGRDIAALAVYAEPEETPGGVIYRPRAAAESGPEGISCVDDVARAVVLGLRAWEQERLEDGRALAQQWLAFVNYMQGEDGRFTNFILDATGRRNISGQTSYPGGLWWTGRALWALGTAYRVLGDEEALERWLRCPLPDRSETAARAKVTSVLALAALEILRAGPPLDVRRRVQPLLEGWCADLMGCMDGYLRDAPGLKQVDLWGYHQLPALAAAGGWLGRDEYLNACAQTVERVIEPALEAGFLYSFPGVKEGQCAYCISPMIHGLAELYRVTGNTHYAGLALTAYGWFTGKNDAGAVMYDPVAGRCLDGIAGNTASRNCGAESAIEAGLAELARRACSAAVPGGATSERRLILEP